MSKSRYFKTLSQIIVEIIYYILIINLFFAPIQTYILVHYTLDIQLKTGYIYETTRSLILEIQSMEDSLGYCCYTNNIKH